MAEHLPQYCINCWHMGHAKEDYKANDQAFKLKRLGKKCPAAVTDGLTADRRVIKAMKAVYVPQVGSVEVGDLGPGGGESVSADTQGGLDVQEPRQTRTQEKVEVVNQRSAFGMGGAYQEGWVGMVAHGVGCGRGDSAVSQGGWNFRM